MTKNRCDGIIWIGRIGEEMNVITFVLCKYIDKYLYILWIE